MPAKKKKLYGGRSLLNLPGHESTAAIVAEIENTSTWKAGKGHNGKDLKHTWEAEPSMMLQFANCDRSISFSTSIADKDEYSNTLHKIDTMIDLLVEFRSGIIVEYERYNERVKHLADDD